MEARLGDIETTFKESLIQLFDIEQVDLEFQAMPIDQPIQKSVEGKGVIRACGDTQSDNVVMFFFAGHDVIIDTAWESGR